jgi:hypothetical protein
MKRSAFFLVFVIASLLLSAQSNYIPLTELTTLEGVRVTTRDIFDDSDITILVFFKTCNQKCCQQLDAMQDIWQDSLADKGVQLVAVCVDGVGDWSHVRPLVNGNCWEFDTYIDLNCDFKRAMNVSHIPCTIMLDATQNLLCRYNGFCSGIDKMMCEKVNHYQLAELD